MQPAYVLPPTHHCPPVDPADLPALRQHLRTAPKKLRALVVVIASTGRRAKDVRHMRWQEVRLHEGVWLYKPGRWLTLTPATCAAIKALPEAGPWVFPNRWRHVEHPWSEDAVEKSWELFRQSLPGALCHLTLTGLRASREEWLKQEQAEGEAVCGAGVPFHVRQQPADLSALIERLQQHPGTDEGITVKEVAELYFQYHLAAKPSYDLHRRTFYKEFEGVLNRPVTNLKKIELIAWHASRRAVPSQANRALSILRTMCNWAIGLDLLKGTNPTAGIRKFPTHSRERAVEPEEMPKLLWAIETASPRNRAFFSVCLFTGARGGEVRHMEWQHVNLERRIWFKPTTKNGRPHRVPLSRQVVEVLAALPRDGRWVFPGTAGQPLASATPRKAWEALRQVAGLPDVTIHDLRRSMATWLASRNVNLSTIQHALNHSSLQPTAIYARMHLSSLDTALQTMADQMQESRRLCLPG
jgi:integrase